MQNKNKYIIGTLVLALSLTIAGCSSSIAKLSVKDDEVVTIDATSKVNPNDYLENVVEGASVDYSISDGVMTITVTKDDKTETFEVPVEIKEPNVSIDENITIDTYVGYDLEDYIDDAEGVGLTTSVDEETGELSVTCTKGEWTTTLDSDVNVTSSKPSYEDLIVGKTYEASYSCSGGTAITSYRATIRENGVVDGYDILSNFARPGSWTIDGNVVYLYDSISDTTDTVTVSEDGKTFSGTESSTCCVVAPCSNPVPITVEYVQVED